MASQNTTGTETEMRSNGTSFKGRGLHLFGIYCVNILLTVLTFGIYSFWGKARILQYIYGSTEMAGSPFMFHGKGIEFFIGFLKALLLLAVPFAALMGGQIYAEFTKHFLVYYLCLLFFIITTSFIIPLAINGRYRYRMSRTSWRGIHLGYKGKNRELLPLFLKNYYLTLLTLGIYSSWMTVALRQYVYGKIRFGNLKFRYTGKGNDLFIINLKGFFLIPLTLGIYSFWYLKDLYKFHYDNIDVCQDGRSCGRLELSATPGKVFRLMALNIVILILTLGLGYPWVQTRNLNFLFSNMIVPGEANPDSLVQTGDSEYKNAMGDDMADILDLGDLGI